jgi:hypothetical protein
VDSFFSKRILLKNKQPARLPIDYFQSPMMHYKLKIRAFHLLFVLSALLFGATVASAEVLWSLAGATADSNAPSNSNTTSSRATNVTGSDGNAYGISAVGMDAASFDVNGATDIAPADGTDDTFYIRHHQSTRSTTVDYATGYSEFSISAAPGYALNLTSLDFDSARGGTSGIRGFEIFGAPDAVPTASDSLLLVSNEAVSVTRDTPLARSIDLSAAEYQNIQSITFRYYPLADANGNSIEFTNMELIGEVISNGLPVFTADPINEITVTEGTAYSSTLADDAIDPDNDPLTFSKLTGPGWLSVAADGTLSGTPTSNDPGLNVFTVQVDAVDGSDTATLNIMVLDATPGQYDVKDYGAIGDGTGNDTAAINSAIDAANAGGGGTVIFPAGDYPAASIELKSYVTLHLTTDATIVARSDGYNDWEYNPYDEDIMDPAYYHWEASLIWGANLINVGIEGTGKIDGSNLKKTSNHVNGTGDKGVGLKLCDGVTIKDVSFWVDDTSSFTGPHYMFLLTGCDNVTIDNITVQTKRDAINLISCRDVLVENCNLDSVRGNNEGGDDAIKLGSDYSLGYVRSSYNIAVRNCVIEAGTNALQFGTETIGPFSNISFENITINYAGKAGCGITANDGSVIDGVTYSDITMSKVLTPIFMKVSNVARVPSQHSYSTGAIKNVSFTNITASDITSFQGEMPVVLWGKTNSYIENVTFDNVDFTVKGGQPFSVAAALPPENDERFPRDVRNTIPGGVFPSYAYYLRHVKGLKFYNGCSVAFESNDDRPAIIIDDGTTSASLGGVELDGVTMQQGSGSQYLIEIRNTVENFYMHDCFELPVVQDTVSNTQYAPANQPPVFSSNPISASDATEGVAYSSSLTEDASDPNGDPLSFSKVSGPAWLSVAANGTLSGTPSSGDVGVNEFTVQVAAIGGFDTATLNILVNAAPVNQAPTFDSETISASGAKEGVAYSSSLVENASDPESDPLSFSKLSGPDWLIVATDGTLSGTPSSGDIGSNVFTVQVAASGGSDTATLSITVQASDFVVLWGIAGAANGTSVTNSSTTTTSVSNVTGPDGSAFGSSGVGIGGFEVGGESDINPVDGESDTWYVRLKQSSQTTTVDYQTGYVEFTITADFGHVLNLSSLTFDSARESKGGTRGFGIYGAPNGTPTASDQLLLVPNEVTSATRDDPLARSIDLSAAEYQNIESITFRYYPLGSGGKYIEFTNMKLNGTVDEISSFSSWAGEQGVTATYTSDSDGDGVVNLLEYALGGDPHLADADSVVPVAGMVEVNEAPYFYFEHKQRTDSSNLVYTILTKSDLSLGAEWIPATVSLVEESSPVDGIKTVRHRIAPDGSARFFKLQVEEVE